jgi:hypothetical protein
MIGSPKLFLVFFSLILSPLFPPNLRIFVSLVALPTVIIHSQGETDANIFSSEEGTRLKWSAVAWTFRGIKLKWSPVAWTARGTKLKWSPVAWATRGTRLKESAVA